MTRGYDDLTLSYLRQNYDKSRQKCPACKSFDIENKFLNPIWMWGQKTQD